MKLKISAILKILIAATYDEISQTDCSTKMSEAMGISVDSNRIRHAVEQQDLFFDTAHKMLDYLGFEIGVVVDGFLPFSNTADALRFVDDELKRQRIPKTEVAQRLGIHYQTLMGKFKQKNSKIGCLSHLCNVVGYELVVQSKADSSRFFIVGDDDYWDYKYKQQLEEINTYREEVNMESIESFFKNGCDIDIKAKIGAEALYSAYSRYCSQNHFRSLNYRDFLRYSREKASLFKNEFYGVRVVC